MLFQSSCLLLLSLAGYALAGEEVHAEDHGQHYHDQHQHIEVHAPQPYDFGYKVVDEYGNKQFRQEKGDGQGTVKGSYGYTDKHGIFRKVVYIADKWGYRANVQTNEPGTASQNPAAVHLDSHATPFQYGQAGLHGEGEVYAPQHQEQVVVKEATQDAGYQLEGDHYGHGLKREDHLSSGSTPVRKVARKGHRRSHQ